MACQSGRRVFHPARRVIADRGLTWSLPSTTASRCAAHAVWLTRRAATPSLYALRRAPAARSSCRAWTFVGSRRKLSPDCRTGAGTRAAGAPRVSRG